MSDGSKEFKLAPGEKLCPDCKGRRKINMVWYWEDPCRTCKGRGKVASTTEEADLLRNIVTWKVGESTTIFYGSNNEYFEVDGGDLVHINRSTETIHVIRSSSVPRKAAGRIEEGRVDQLVSNIDSAEHMERLEMV